MRASGAWRLAVLLAIVVVISFGIGYQFMLRFMG